MKYIENITPHKVNITVAYDDPSGDKQYGLAKKVKITFRPEKINTFSNTIEHTAFTTVDDETYVALCKNIDFAYAINQDSNHHWLKVHDELPEEVQTPSDALTAARRRIQELEQKLADSGDVSEVQEKLDTALAENKAMAEKIAGLEGQITNLNGQIETLKKAKKGEKGEL